MNRASLPNARLVGSGCSSRLSSKRITLMFMKDGHCWSSFAEGDYGGRPFRGKTGLQQAIDDARRLAESDVAQRQSPGYDGIAVAVFPIVASQRTRVVKFYPWGNAAPCTRLAEPLTCRDNYLSFDEVGCTDGLAVEEHEL